MPTTSSSHAHTISGAGRNPKHTLVTVYAYGRIEDIAGVALEVLQEKHRAALSLLGVTLQAYELTNTTMPGWTAIDLITYERYVSDFYNAVSTSGTDAIDPVTVVDPVSAVAGYIKGACVSDYPVEINSYYEFRRKHEEYMARQRNALVQEYKLASLYNMNNLEQYRRVTTTEIQEQFNEQMRVAKSGVVRSFLTSKLGS